MNEKLGSIRYWSSNIDSGQMISIMRREHSKVTDVVTEYISASKGISDAHLFAEGGILLKPGTLDSSSRCCTSVQLRPSTALLRHSTLGLFLRGLKWSEWNGTVLKAPSIGLEIDMSQVFHIARLSERLGSWILIILCYWISLGLSQEHLALYSWAKYWAKVSGWVLM